MSRPIASGKSPRMTLLDALDRARDRWGDRATIHVELTRHAARRGGFATFDDVMLFSVGDRGHDDHAWGCRGQGESWEQAFEEADRQHRPARRTAT